MTTQVLDRTFAALADPTRRAILGRLSGGEASVTELAAPFSMSLPADLQTPEGAGARRADLARAHTRNGGRAGSKRRR